MHTQRRTAPTLTPTHPPTHLAQQDGAEAAGLERGAVPQGAHQVLRAHLWVRLELGEHRLRLHS